MSLYAVDAAGAGAIVELAWTNGAITLFPLFLAPFMLVHLLDISILPLLLTMFFSLSVMIFLSWRQSRFFWHFKKLAAERTGLVNEWVQNIRALRALGWIEAFETKIFKKRLQETNNRVAMVSNGHTMASLGASVGFLLNLAGIYALVKMRPGSTLSPGELTATFWALGVYLARPLRSVPWILTFTLDSYTSIRRVERFLSLKSDDIRVTPTSLPEISGETPQPFLEIAELSLELDGKTLLKDVSVKIDKPEFVAVVGPVGSGKTLFIQSLIGEVPAHFAKYSLQGEDVANFDEETLKSRFSLVPQDGFIASTTIRNNVLLDYSDNSEIDDSPSVQNSLENARFPLQAEGFVDGEFTLLGERGINLSGGQRQRLGLARALKSARPVLILDDSLSAVDVNTEREMIASLFKRQLRDKLVLLVTHRHLTLTEMDRVLFFKNGCLIGNGTFEELLKTSAEFRAFMREAEEKERVRDELVT